MRRQSPGLTNHKVACDICKHAEKDGIERAYMNHVALNRIERIYTLKKGTVARHAAMFPDLDRRRKANQMKILDLAIAEAAEQVSAMKFKPKDLVDLMIAKAKLDGTLVINFKDLTDQMRGKSNKQLEHFAKTGELLEESEMPTEMDGPVGVQ